jgi:hypothetical protein
VCCFLFCCIKQRYSNGISLRSVYRGTKMITGNYWTQRTSKWNGCSFSIVLDSTASNLINGVIRHDHSTYRNRETLIKTAYTYFSHVNFLAPKDAYAASQGAVFDTLTTQYKRRPIVSILVQPGWFFPFAFAFFSLRICMKTYIL